MSETPEEYIAREKYLRNILSDLNDGRIAVSQAHNLTLEEFTKARTQEREKLIRDIEEKLKDHFDGSVEYSCGFLNGIERAIEILNNLKKEKP